MKKNKKKCKKKKKIGNISLWMVIKEACPSISRRAILALCPYFVTMPSCHWFI